MQGSNGKYLMPLIARTTTSRIHAHTTSGCMNLNNDFQILTAVR